MKVLTIFLLAFQLNSFCQSKIYIIGKIEDFETKKAITAARIYNFKAKAGATSNERGAFFIWAMPGDSCSITAKGYNSRTFICRKITKDTTFSLINDPTYVTTLDEVIVQGKKTDQMKREIKELFEEDLKTGKFNAGSLISGGSSTPGQMGAGISIGAIYDYFSTSGKDHRKADYLTQQSRFKFYADWRLNRKLVTKLTGLTGIDLEDFMKYLKLDTDYILKASDYELNESIINAYQSFKTRNDYYVKPK